LAQFAGGTCIAVEQADAAVFYVNCAHEIASTPDRPSDRGGVKRQRLLDLIDEVDRIAGLAIHLVPNRPP
jgi:hypothetical protein